MKRVIVLLIFVLIFIGGCGVQNSINNNLKEQTSYYVCPDSSIIVSDLNLCPKEKEVLPILDSQNKEIEESIKEPVKDDKEIKSEYGGVEEDIKELVNSSKEVKSEDDCKYVGSKNSDKYHKPSCVWAKKIKLENLVCFSSKEEAEDKGYKPCSVCKPGNE